MDHQNRHVSRYPRRTSENLRVSVPSPVAKVHSRRSQTATQNSKRAQKPQSKSSAKTSHKRKPSTTQSNGTSTSQSGGPWKALFNFTTRRHLPSLVSSILCSVIVGIVTPVQAYLMGKVFSNFAKFGAGQMTEKDFSHKQTQYNLYFVVLGAICWLFTAGLFAGWVTFGELQARSARDRMFNALVDRDMEWFDQRKDGVGALTARLQSFVLELQYATAQPLGLIIRDFTTACASIGLAFYMSWKLTFVIMSTLPVVAVIVPLISSRIQPNIELQIAKLSEAAKHIMNAFSVIETVKCYNGQAAELWMYSRLLGNSAIFYTRQVNWNALQASLLRFVTLAMFVQGFWYGSTLVDKQKDVSGTILTAFWSCIMATGAIMQIMPQLIFLEKGRIAGHKLRVVMAAMSAASTQHPVGSQTPLSCKGDIEFSNVYFAYPSRPQHLALRGANLLFAAGDMTFVIGKSGSGKSTVGQLLMQFYHPSQGSISLDNVSLATLDPHWIRSNILLVEQQSVLFNTTLRENIALGAGDPESVTLEEVHQVTEFASIRSPIESMPFGFETNVGSKGGSLSGGQRQRVALARARLCDPPVLVLDESTSALDYINRLAVMAAIRKWRRGKTTIIITHDISQILPDDFLYIMEDGQVVQEGFRKNLSDEEGCFQEFLNPSEESPKRKHSDVNKSLPPTPVEEDLSPQDSTISLPQSALSSISLQDPLFQFFEEPRNRASVLVPSIFTHRLGAAPTRDTRHMPQVVAPFWSVLPATGRISPLAESNESRRSSYVGSVDEIPVSPIMEAFPVAFHRLSRATQRMSTLTMRRISGGMPDRYTKFPRHEAIQEIPEEMDVRRSLTDGEGRVDKSSKVIKKPKEELAKYTVKAILLTVWPILDWKQRIALLLGFAAALGYAASTPLFAFVFSKLLGTFYNPVDRKKQALKYSLAILGIAMGDAITIFINLSHLQHLAQTWVNKVRLQALDRILDQPREFFDMEENSVSRMAECLDHHADEMQGILGRFVGNILIVFVMVTMAVVWSLVSCWKLTLVLLACTPVLFGIQHGLAAVSGVTEKAIVDASEFAGSVFTETFTNIKTVRSLTLENHFRTKHQTAAENVLKAGIRKGLYGGALYGLSQSVLLFIIALIFYYGGVLLSTHQFKLSDILQVFTLLLLSISNATMILAAIPQLSASREAAARLLRLADLPVGSHEHVGKARIPHVGDIAFHDTNFRYPLRPDALVLDGVDLMIPSGSCVALVGTSGSGKSTIAALLLNLYATTSHKEEDFNPAPDITFANRDIRRIHTPTLRNLITIVSQTPTLFPLTIFGNIVYGLRRGDPLNTTVNVRSAAIAAGIDDFISSLPEGYDTLIGEGGMGLSGGQAQRIAIARALARRPDVLILDEATSALDVESANVVRDSIKNILAEDRRQGGRGMTIIIITHSKEMMKIAETIIMMEKGRVVEEGGYEELVRRNGQFARLLRGEAWEISLKKNKRRSVMLMQRASGIVQS